MPESLNDGTAAVLGIGVAGGDQTSEFLAKLAELSSPH